MSEPADDTRRLVAADWLQENYSNTPSAVRRVEVIRYGVEAGNSSPVVNILTAETVTLWEGMGFPEPELKRLDSFNIVRGFPEVVWFDPWRFNIDTVTPIFQACPVRTCSFTIIHPELAVTPGWENPDSHRNVWDWDDGPEDERGLVDDITDLSFGIGSTVGGGTRSAPVEDLVAVATGGVNPHENFYRTERVSLPNPVYYWLPVQTWIGDKKIRNSENVIPRSRFETVREACTAAMKAAWRCGRKWAGMTTRTAPAPHEYAVSMMSTRAEAEYRQETDLFDDPEPEHETGVPGE